MIFENLEIDIIGTTLSCDILIANQVSMYIVYTSTNKDRGRRGRDRMVFGVTTTYAVSTYHH